MAKSKKENMVEPGYLNGVVDGAAGDSSFDDVIGFFESMEGLDEDNVSVDAEDWDAQFQNLGPIPSEVLQGFVHVSTANIGYNTRRIWPDKCVPHHRTNEVKQLPDNDISDGVEVSSDSSLAKGPCLFHTHSPISVLQSSCSYLTEKKIPTGHELLIPVRTRSKRQRPPALCKWHLISPIFPSKKSLNTKRKEGKRKKLPSLLPEELEVKENQKRCTHCQATQTPLWRRGPMGIATLCNACGVKYRCQGVLPVYRFRPWPTAGKKKQKLPQLPKDAEVMGNYQHLHYKRCTYCLVTESPEWRDDPMGSGTLCNACGVQYQLNDVLPECRCGPVEKKRKKRPRLPEDVVVPENHLHIYDKRCPHCQVMETPEWRDGQMESGTLRNTCGDQYQLGHLLPDFHPSPVEKRKKNQLVEVLGVKESQRMNIRRCTHCQVAQTPQWREGPMGPKTLCNACGVCYKKGRLLPEYRPLASPTFVPSLHSNSHKKVLQMRNELIQKSSLPEMNPAVYPQPGSFPMNVMQTRNEVFQESSIHHALCHPPGHIPMDAMQMRNEVAQEHFVPRMNLAMSPQPESIPKNAIQMGNEVVQEFDVPKMEPAMVPPPEFVPMSGYLHDVILG